MDAFSIQLALKESIRGGQPTLGLFVKTPSSHLVESLAGTGIGFIVLDAEHAPFGPAELDQCILAGRSIGLPVLVRLREATAAAILEVLDMGAAGIIAPHVHSAEQAIDIVAATKYDGGARGFSGAHRAAVYGAMPAGEYKTASDESTIVIAQIEDSDGLNNVDEIAAVDSLDALLIGRADLCVSLGAGSIDDDSVVQAVDTILAACKQKDMSASIYLPTADECAGFRAKGVNLFFISTDQALINEAASALARDFR